MMFFDHLELFTNKYNAKKNCACVDPQLRKIKRKGLTRVLNREYKVVSTDFIIAQDLTLIRNLNWMLKVGD